MPLTRRQIYLRRRSAVGAALAVVLGAAFYLPLTLLAPLSPVTAQILPYAAPAAPVPALSFPAYGASAIGAVGFPGVLASSGTVDALPIASITKVITALVVLETKPIAAGEAGPEVRFSAADEGFYNRQLAQNGSVHSVRSGQVMSQFQLLEVVLIASANNYAQSLVAWAFGSESAFLDATRDWLAANGLTTTTITDASGILPTNTSTASDLVELAKLAVANPVVSQIMAMQNAEIPELGTIKNTNQLLGIDGVDGIKTGTLDEAGSCLLFSADYPIGSGAVTVVGVVLGGPDHDTIDANIRTLLAGVVSGFHEVPLVAAGHVFASYQTAWGERTDAVAANNESVILWADTPITVLVQVAELRLAEAGTDVGLATFTVGEQTVMVTLELDSAIADPGPWWRLANPTELF